MFQLLIQWVKNLFGKTTGHKTQTELQESENYKRRYEDGSRVNFDAVFAGSLANKAVTDCRMTVTDSGDGESRRSRFISDVLSPVWDGIKPVLAQALGKGGKFLIPCVTGGKVCVSGVDQSRCVVNQTDGGGEITSLSVVAEVREIGTKTYRRILDYTLEGGVLTIQTRVADDLGPACLDVVPEWMGITPEIRISNVDRVPVAYLRCPKDSRKEWDFYGVPITYGAEDIVRQLYECMEDIESEYRLKRAFVGADELLFGKDDKLPTNGLFRLFRSGGALRGDGGKTFWEVYDPAIRDSAYYARFNALCALLEKAVGTSRGILTEPATASATATEIKAANHDTFCLVSDIRKGLEECFEDLAYSVDLYAEHFGLTPAGAAGDYKVTFDWDMSMVESSSETFSQLSELESRGLVSGARLNAWVTGQSMEDAQAEIDAAAKTRKPLLTDADGEDDPIVKDE